MGAVTPGQSLLALPHFDEPARLFNSPRAVSDLLDPCFEASLVLGKRPRPVSSHQFHEGSISSRKE
jgi:hypothetical protein